MIQNYRQTDPRWADMLIGGGAMTMLEGGCGICAIADVVDQRPDVVGAWMESRGYIYKDQGTVHEGVVPTLRHFGYDGEMITPGYVNGQMASDYFRRIYNHVEAGYAAILLMGGTQTNAGGRCRTDFWSYKGHYICIAGAAASAMLAHDPYYPVRDGWHSIVDYAGAYQDSYNGNVKKIWTTSARWKEEDGFVFKMSDVRKGDIGVDAYQLQVQMRARDFAGENGKPIKLDFSAGKETFFAWGSYCDARARQGVILDKTVVDKKGWADLFGKC